jgi:hypothetical protein
MKKIFVTLIVLLIAFAVVMPAAAGDNGSGAGGNGIGQPGTCLCGNSTGMGNSYGPGQAGVCTCGNPTDSGNSYGPGEPGPNTFSTSAGTGNNYGPGRPGTPGNGNQVLNGYSYGQRPLGASAGISVAAAANASLTSAESTGLVFMYEEEKLARDVYNIMYARWNQPVFKNIAASEQTHMNAIRTLLIRYGLTVPQSAAGVFQDTSLQNLYDQLAASANQSLVDAYKAGVTIEQKDIADLQSRLAQTTHADIRQVYTNLLNASNNHLASFIGLLGSLGG